MLAICLADGGELYAHSCQSQTPALTNEQRRCSLGNKPNSVQFVTADVLTTQLSELLLLLFLLT